MAESGPRVKGSDFSLKEGFSLVVVLAIAAASLVVAIVTFGVLESSGEVTDSLRSVSGAVVGFLISFAVISASYARLLHIQSTAVDRRLRDRNESLREQVEELSQQLIRGAGRPEGYDIEALEHHQIVMARPSPYVSRGGVIMDLQEPPEEQPDESGEIDLVPARLFVKYIPAPRHTTVDDFYDDYASRAEDNAVYELKGCERTVVGEDIRAVPSLRVTWQGVSAVNIHRDPISAEIERHSRLIPRAGWDEVEIIETPRTKLAREEDGSFQPQTIHVRVRMANVVCFHVDLKRVFFFGFEDDEIDFVRTVEALNRSLRSVRFLT